MRMMMNYKILFKVLYMMMTLMNKNKTLFQM